MNDMITRLIGIYDDGTRPLTGRPFNPRVPLRVVQRAPTELFVAVHTPAEVPFLLLVGDTFRLTVTDRSGCSPQPLLSIAGARAPALGSHHLRFEISSENTADLSPRMYQYDIWMVRAETPTVLVPTSPFYVERSLYAP